MLGYFLCLLLVGLASLCEGYKHWMPNTTYCHVHIAKTGGTSLNEIFANNFERVCGHKGYSFDFYQSNARAKKNSHRDITNLKDSVSEKYKIFNRERVHEDIMNERGFEDCDWISLEAKWSYWKDVARRVGPLELHVPCREPVDHLMSMCNMWGHKFDCNAANMTKEVSKCLHQFDRFSYRLSSIANTTIKCFPYKTQFVDYKAVMDRLLEDRKMVGKVTKLETNLKRKANEECIWKEPKVKVRVRDILLAIDYFEFCDKCVGSNDDVTVFN